MKSWIKKTLVTMCTVVLVVMIGCAAMMNAVTPCFIEPEVIKDANESPTSFMPFTTLWDAERIINKFDYNFQVGQIGLIRLIEDKKMRRDFFRGLQMVHVGGAQEFQKTIFSPEGVVGILVPSLAIGTIGALLIKRPGDKSAKEVEEIVKHNT